MKLSKYIAGLTKFMEEEGDLECYSASDDEGNSYQPVGYTGSKLFIREADRDEYHPDMYCQEDIDRDEPFISVCIIN